MNTASTLDLRLSAAQLDELMEEALYEAHVAASQGEVPVGAVLARRNGSSFEVIASAHNEVERRSDVSAHAEVLAIQRASSGSGNWRLDDALLAVTLEPCTMCAGAIKLARIPVVAFGAEDPLMGAFGSQYDLSQAPGHAPAPRIISGIMAEKCAAVLREFFEEKRRKACADEAWESPHRFD